MSPRDDASEAVLHPFNLVGSREAVTGEPEPDGRTPDALHSDQDYLGFANQGGGHVPEDHEWTSNPRQVQEDLEGN